MSEEFLGERRKALEEQFFRQEEEKKLSAFREKLAREATREELQRASGIGDNAVLNKLLDLGVTPQAITVLNLVPLIEVAWADGKMQSEERAAILKGAAGQGIDEVSAAYGLLSSWLDQRPGSELFAAWEGYVAALVGQLSAEQVAVLRERVIIVARGVAEAAGGFLGIGTVATSEEKVLERVAAAFKV